MNNNFPVWYKLIHYWCRQRVPKGYGLTIPFIIGATDNLTIATLLNEIKESQLADKIILRICHDLNEYVLSVNDNNNPIANHLNGEKSLLYNDEKVESLNSFNEVVIYLESKYSKIIIDKTYSKNMRTGEWEEYTQSDMEIINKVISN